MENSFIKAKLFDVQAQMKCFGRGKNLYHFMELNIFLFATVAEFIHLVI